MTYKRILVAVDASKTSARGLKEAIGLARDGGAKLRLLHVVEGYSLVGVPEIGANLEPILKSLRAGAAKTLAGIVRAAKRAGAQPESVLVEAIGSRVADAIVGQARRWRADLIVMGTHGRRGVQRLMLGSDAELVVRHATMPVLLVPAVRPKR